MANEGQKMRNRATGEVAVFQNGGWHNLGVVPMGATARPDFGQGAYESGQGDIMAPSKSGDPRMLKAAPQEADANLRARLNMGLAPMIEGQEGMARIERQGNPFALNQHPDNAVAKAIGDVGISAGPVQFHPFEGLAKHIGGQDFQDYQQSAAAFEAQLMPIMSGAAVSPSEAQRQIRAALPELGDSPETLQHKARTRAMMLNGAAKMKGLPPPYPHVPTFGINAGGPQAPAGPKRLKFDASGNPVNGG